MGGAHFFYKKLLISPTTSFSPSPLEYNFLFSSNKSFFLSKKYNYAISNETRQNKETTYF